MFASMRSKSKKALHGSAGAKTDQQPQPTQRRDAMPAPLQLAEKPLYYPGTSMPMEGWFHACRLCRCWTAFSATAATGELVPLCRRCLPVAARKGLSTSRGSARSSPQQQPQQQQQQHNGSTAATAADVRSRLPATYPAAAAATAAPKASPLAGAPEADDMQPAAKTGSDPARVVTSACVPASTVQQQQRHHDVAPPPRARQQDARSSTSAPSAPPASAALGSASMTAVHASRTAVHSRPVAYDQQQPQQQHQPYTQQAWGVAATVPLPAGAGAAYASYHKHLGPSNMQQSAPADHFIACIDDGGNDDAAAGCGGGSQQSAGSDVLGAITALLADLYRLSFSSSSSASGGCGSGAGTAAQQPQAGAQGATCQPPV